MYNLILVPLDGSHFAEYALPLALSLSRRTAAQVHLLTVQEHLPTRSPEGWEEAARDWHQAYLDELAGRIRSRAGGEITTKVRLGHVVEEIQTEAEARGVDLVVMATHGRGALSRAWMGAIADSFIRHADRPVLLVRPGEGDADPSLEADSRIEKILLPLDGTEVSEGIIDHAAEMGALFGAAFHLVRMVPFPKGFKSPYPPHLIAMNREFLTDAKDAAEGYLEEQARRLRARGMVVDTAVVEVGQAGHGILTEAEVAGCDFIAMATHGRGPIARTILGSTADKVVRGAHVPVLLYRRRD
ncbi:MAG: universal stress protein [Longimicrobiales bacterium]